MPKLLKFANIMNMAPCGLTNPPESSLSKIAHEDVAKAPYDIGYGTKGSQLTHLLLCKVTLNYSDTDVIDVHSAYEPLIIPR